MNTALRARVSPDRISVIPNAVEFAMFAPPSEPRQSEDTVIIVLCRLMYRKGIDLLAQVGLHGHLIVCLLCFNAETFYLTSIFRLTYSIWQARGI